jgi:hypothetical protein
MIKIIGFNYICILITSILIIFLQMVLLHKTETKQGGDRDKSPEEDKKDIPDGEEPHYQNSFSRMGNSKAYKVDIAAYY